ncbi:hypothetical protein M1B72_09110 [Geomonas paludis]|uniref:Uncharacterized protein n=2 Tax=Geomonas TaxID=2651583 RepID=A0ABY4LIM2_9BACT|nr:MULTISPECIES: hypothetical protein [Geomonas]MBJ6749468.1 hypothetical protein [Geomonas anaerohicana]UPU37848.1 hypothetical protein M1B72_09110 [Geomonas paludis]
MSITDILLLAPAELLELRDRYPDGNFEKLTNWKGNIQEYRVQLEGEDEEGYYSVLQDIGIAMSSHSFYTKVKTDQSFADRVRQRNGLSG